MPEKISALERDEEERLAVTCDIGLMEVLLEL